MAHSPPGTVRLWEFARIGGEDVLATCIIVGEPNPLVAGVHDPMPVMVMLMAADYDRWLVPAAVLQRLTALFG